MLDAIAARLGQNRASGPPPEVGETPSTAAVAASELSFYAKQVTRKRKEGDRQG